MKKLSFVLVIFALLTVVVANASDIGPQTPDMLPDVYLSDISLEVSSNF